MSAGQSKEGLVPVPSAALLRTGATTLARRGLLDLQLAESADQWLQKAEECFSAAVARMTPYLKDGRYQEANEDEQHCALMRDYFVYLKRAVDAGPNYPKHWPNLQRHI